MIHHYLLCDAANHVDSIETVECDNDDTAHERAIKLFPRRGVRVVEVWQGPRRVERVEETS